MTWRRLREWWTNIARLQTALVLELPCMKLLLWNLAVKVFMVWLCQHSLVQYLTPIPGGSPLKQSTCWPKKKINFLLCALEGKGGCDHPSAFLSLPLTLFAASNCSCLLMTCTGKCLSFFLLGQPIFLLLASNLSVRSKGSFACCFPNGAVDEGKGLQGRRLTKTFGRPHLPTQKVVSVCQWRMSVKECW